MPYPLPYRHRGCPSDVGVEEAGARLDDALSVPGCARDSNLVFAFIFGLQLVGACLQSSYPAPGWRRNICHGARVSLFSWVFCSVLVFEVVDGSNCSILQFARACTGSIVLDSKQRLQRSSTTTKRSYLSCIVRRVGVSVGAVRAVETGLVVGGFRDGLALS